MRSLATLTAVALSAASAAGSHDAGSFKRLWESE